MLFAGLVIRTCQRLVCQAGGRDMIYQDTSNNKSLRFTVEIWARPETLYLKDGRRLRGSKQIECKIPGKSLQSSLVFHNPGKNLQSYQGLHNIGRNLQSCQEILNLGWMLP